MISVADLKLFKVASGGVTELSGHSAPLERELQTMFEQNLEAFVGVRLLASEFVTSNGGRMDTLGIDENNCPVIIEYKRRTGENVINQGLFYLDWLMDHKAEFQLLVLNKYGKGVADAIEWGAPRLICIAGDFTKFDSHAVNQMNRNIELIRYVRFNSDLVLLEQTTATTTPTDKAPLDAGAAKPNSYKTVSDLLAQSDEDLTSLFNLVKEELVSLGDDVVEKTLKNYFAFRRIKNFACVEVKPQARRVLVYLKVDPDTIELTPDFMRDVRKVGHFGTGDLEVIIRTVEDFENARALFRLSYENS